MIREDRLRRLLAMVKKYDATTNTATFRNDYRAVVDGAVEAGEVEDAEVSAFVQAREYLEAWGAKRPPELKAAFSQWRDLFEKSRDFLPPLFLEALLSRIPPKPAAKLDIGPLFENAMGGRFLRIMLSRRLLKLAELLQLAKSDPSVFYRSPALDIVVESGKSVPRGVWAQAADGAPRPPDLMDPALALVTSFRADKKRDAGKWLLKYLAESASIAPSILRALLRDPEAATRLAIHLGIESIKWGAPKRRLDSGIQGLTGMWIGVATKQLSEGGAESRTSGTVLSVMRLSAILDPRGYAARAISEAPSSLETTFEGQVADGLRLAESGDLASAKSMALLVQVDEVYRAVQQYLRSTPGASASSASPDRFLRHERYLGRKDIVQELLPVLDGVANPTALRDAVEVALFNVGVRPLGEAGELARFDPQRHQVDGEAAAPGEPVRVVRPGLAIGETDGVVLRKAVVRLEGATSGKGGQAG